MALIHFPPAEFQEFKLYRERRLANIPLDKLRLEPIREPTPSISFSGSSGTDKSRSKSRKESPKCSKRSESDHNKSEGSIRDTAQSKECPEQQVLTTPQVKVPPPIIQPSRPVRTEMDKEWETLNELINTKEQNMKTPENTVQTVTDMVIETVSNAPEMEHVPITPSSEIMIKIEEILPLGLFYSPQHKAVVRRQRKKRKLNSVLSPEAEQLDILWRDPTTDPTKNLTKLSQIAGAYASATIDKVSEVQQLLKDREEQTQVLQQ